jgi:chemotaxis protein methyltransferase CheR
MVATKPVEPREAAPPPPVAPVGAGEIVRILEQGDGNPNAERVVASLREAGVPVSELGGAELIAAALSLINAGDSSAADLVLSFLEKRGSSPAISFLRGEFYYRAANAAAEEKYQEAMVGDTGFWPAFYRISSLAEDGNRTRYEYRLKRALESMEKGAGLGYEIFIGGFSPDYYRRILERKLAE